MNWTHRWAYHCTRRRSCACQAQPLRCEQPSGKDTQFGVWRSIVTANHDVDAVRMKRALHLLAQQTGEIGAVLVAAAGAIKMLNQ